MSPYLSMAEVCRLQTTKRLDKLQWAGFFQGFPIPNTLLVFPYHISLCWDTNLLLMIGLRDHVGPHT